MFFIAQLTHSPELCFGRAEHKEKAKEFMEFMENIEKYEKEAGGKVHGFYLNPNEHTFYFIIEADNFGKISKIQRGNFVSFVRLGQGALCCYSNMLDM